MTWQIAPFLPGAVVVDLAVSGDRVIAVGRQNGAAAAWVSGDGGGSWTPSELPDLDSPADGAELHMGGVAASSGTLVATGYWVLPDGTADFVPELFVSRDGGMTWARSELNGTLLGPFDVVSAGDDGFIGVGFDPALAFTLWSSRSGEAWRRLETVGLDRQTQSFAARNGQGVAVGVDARRDGLLPSFLWSANLLEWEAAQTDTENAGFVGNVVAFGSGYAAGGARWLPERQQQDGWAVVWLSNDGHSWLEVPLTGAEGRQVSSLAASETGVAAVISSLGRAEERVAFLPLGASAVSSTVVMPFQVETIASTPDGYVAAGQCAAGVEPCEGSFLAIGTLSESADVQDPTLPPQASATPGG